MLLELYRSVSSSGTSPARVVEAKACHYRMQTRERHGAFCLDSIVKNAQQALRILRIPDGLAPECVHLFTGS
jgi:hypothetical protein